MVGFLLVASLWAGAQWTDLPTLILPPGEGAWVVRVETTGGFSGRGTGSVTASSGGELFCVAVASCPDRLVDDAQRSLAALITEIPLVVAAPAPPPPMNHTVCNDCVTTTLTVRRRVADGERSVVYTWDPSTAAAVPEEIRKLHARILVLTSSRDR